MALLTYLVLVAPTTQLYQAIANWWLWQDSVVPPLNVPTEQVRCLMKILISEANPDILNIEIRKDTQ